MEISPTINERCKFITLLTFIFCVLFTFFLTKHSQISTHFITLPLQHGKQSQQPQQQQQQQQHQQKQPQPQQQPQQHNHTDQFHISDSNLTEKNSSMAYVISLELQENKQGEEKKRVKVCDINSGKWVYKLDAKLSYSWKECPFLEEKMNCRGNGRPDFEYENLVWVPHDCSLVQFNGANMLERLRGKRMVIVGDSMNRNQWESLACLLYKCVDRSKVEGIKLKSKNQKVFIAKDYDFTLEFDFSPFLVNFDKSHKSGSKVLQLDKISTTSKHWMNADIMLFNTGHWWVHQGKFKRWDLFEHKDKLIDKMNIEEAFKIGMSTWAKWIDQSVNPNKTTVLFRTISPQHNANFWCYNVTKPITDESYVLPFPSSMLDIIKNTIRRTQTPVRYLNVTKMSQYRRDAHPGIYRNSRWKVMVDKYKRFLPSFVDCSHWCLPGVPDTWNRVLYASLFSDVSDV